ncbi:MAG: phytoene/squalene synthase family protein [Actinomycetota bacterium]|nr:phytoene/squalene synthase family protein [Actinomycetota bacterium]
MSGSGAPVTLEASYERCRRLNKRYGTTYYWSTFLLPAVKRHHVHALYGLCRYADDIVDDLGPIPVADRAAALSAFGDRFFSDYAAGRSDHPVLKAVVHTVRAFDIDPDCVRRFLASMTMDLSVETYETFDDLLGYMDGSAAVIGEMMLPILEPTSPDAFAPARDLGIAFQLSNFLRDVNEDLDRGRVYLPQEDVRKFAALPALAERRVTPEWMELMRFEIERNRAFYASADRGVALLPPAAARCIAGARALYSGILDHIEAAGYDVFSSRVRVPTWQKLAVAGRLLRPRPPPASVPALLPSLTAKTVAIRRFLPSKREVGRRRTLWR